ncbi:hypothetical protein GIB67_030811, partial [Kingdonia uniflora]
MQFTNKKKESYSGGSGRTLRISNSSFLTGLQRLLLVSRGLTTSSRMLSFLRLQKCWLILVESGEYDIS